jgi:hypothetical protein
MALQCLWSLRIEVPVWADANGINQADDAERTYQVQLMYHIYETTGEVIIYLVEPKES